MFTLKKTDKNHKARLGIIDTDHGKIETPFFMPVGTNGTVKSLTFEHLRDINAQILLANTYHLNLRPGVPVIQEAQGLHKFTGWEKPILTDSGGYQIFSLAKLRELTDDAVEFRSHLDGQTVILSPEKVIEIQQALGSDIMMPLDECAPYPCRYEKAEEAVKRTTAWAMRCKEYAGNHDGCRHRQLLFGIIQGATYKELRAQSTRGILGIGFDGYAIGGVSVGESMKEMFDVVDWVVPHLPEDKPRYLMGIGFPHQIVKAAGEGIDMFDTVLPTRLGRHATAFTRKGRIILRNAEFARDFSPIDEHCTCFVCQKYTRSYIRHLCNQNEMTGLTLTTYHNVHFYVHLMRDIREAIQSDRFEEFAGDFLSSYPMEAVAL